MSMVPGQFGATIRPRQFGAKYISQILYKIPLPLSFILFIKIASISAIFFHQFLTLTHVVLIGIDLLIEFIILYRPTVLNYNQIIKSIFDSK